MTELAINPDDIRAALRDFVEGFTPETTAVRRSGTSPTPATASPGSRVSPRP